LVLVFFFFFNNKILLPYWVKIELNSVFWTQLGRTEETDEALLVLLTLFLEDDLFKTETNFPFLTNSDPIICSFWVVKQQVGKIPSNFVDKLRPSEYPSLYDSFTQTRSPRLKIISSETSGVQATWHL